MAEENKINLIEVEAIPYKETPLIKIGLTSYEWHELLKELEYLRCICNRDQDKCVELWEKIATALSSRNQVVYGSEKHKRLDPDLFKPKEVPSESPSKAIDSPPPKKSLLSKLLGR